ncbi:DUF494 domain-containing protein Smg [Gammaproteobacteria bacterium]
MIKETVLDVLMYLFDNYMDADSEYGTDEESLHRELIDAGFSDAEISKAFQWLEGLSEQQGSLPVATTANSLRIYTDAELERLTVECRGFILFLEQIEVLDHTTRELVIDRVMALEADDIDLDQLKWVVLMVLFNRPGQEAALAWMENLVFNEVHGYLH